MTRNGLAVESRDHLPCLCNLAVDLNGGGMWGRRFIGGVVGALACSLAAGAQTPDRVYRLGHLANSMDSEAFTKQITLPELAGLR